MATGIVNSRKVYIDHTVLFSFIDRAHPKHDQASAYIRYFAEQEYILFTDADKLMQTYMQIYGNISPSLAKDFLRTMELSTVNLIYPDESDMKAALKTLVNYQSTDLTYSHALMAVLANRRAVPQICTFEYLHPLFGLNLFYLPM